VVKDIPSSYKDIAREKHVPLWRGLGEEKLANCPRGQREAPNVPLWRGLGEEKMASFGALPPESFRS